MCSAATRELFDRPHDAARDQPGQRRPRRMVPPSAMSSSRRSRVDSTLFVSSMLRAICAAPPSRERDGQHPVLGARDRDGAEARRPRRARRCALSWRRSGATGWFAIDRTTVPSASSSWTIASGSASGGPPAGCSSRSRRSRAVGRGVRGRPKPVRDAGIVRRVASGTGRSRTRSSWRVLTCAAYTHPTTTIANVVATTSSSRRRRLMPSAPCSRRRGPCG